MNQIQAYLPFFTTIFTFVYYKLTCTVAAINLETPRFFYCKLFLTLTMSLTYQFRL
jgi:hypothetical protein